jgi:hypothetical protein
LSGNARSDLTNIDEKTGNNIPEAVTKLALTAAILVKLSEINMISLIILNKTQSFITG